MSINTLQKSEKSITIGYPIDEVKIAVKRIAEEFTGKYNMITANDIFNTYQFDLINGMIIGIGDMTLESINENRTKLTLIVNNAHGSQGTTPILEGMSNDYLTVLAKVLSGESIENEKKAAKKAGWGGIVALIIIIAGLLWILL